MPGTASAAAAALSSVLALIAASVIGTDAFVVAVAVVAIAANGASNVDDAILLRSMSISLSTDDDVDSLPMIFDDDDDDVIVAV